VSNQHDALIEKMAEAAYLADNEGGLWWETAEHRKVRYRRQARAALAVVHAHYGDPEKAFEAAEARALAAEKAREQAYLDGIVVGKKARDAEIADEDSAIAEEEYAP
jgi:hypothetical protein